MNIKYMLKFFVLPLLAVLLLGSCAASEEEMCQGDDGNCKCMSLKSTFDPYSKDSYNPIEVQYCKKSLLGGTTCSKKGIIDWISSKVHDVVKSASLKIYLKVAFNLEFRVAVAMCMTLSIIFFVVSILLGFTQASGYNALMFVIKLIIIYQLTINYIYFNVYVIQSFEAFVTDSMMFASRTFHDYNAYDWNSLCLGVFGAICDPAQLLDSLFGIDLAEVLGVNDYSSQLFIEMGKFISMFFNERYYKVLMALTATGATGFFWAAMLSALALMYLLAIVVSVKTYLMAMIARYVLYGLGPIFLTFALFNQTRSLFDGWLQQLINFSLQPVFLFIFLGMFHSILAGFMKDIYIKQLGDSTTSYSVTEVCPTINPPADCTIQSCTAGDPGCTCDPFGSCSRMIRTYSASGQNMCVKYVPLDDKKDPNSPKGYKLCSNAGGVENCNASVKPIIPIDIWMVISAIVISYLMLAMRSWVTNIAAQLSSGMVSLGDVKIQGWGNMKQEIGHGISSGFHSLTSGGAKRGGGGGS